MEKKVNNDIFFEQMAPAPLVDDGGDHLPSHQRVENLMTQTAMIGKMVARATVKPVGTEGNWLIIIRCQTKNLSSLW